MKFSYFAMIEDKYSCKISLNKPIIIRLDGKDITKNKSLNIYDESIGGFAYSLRITAREISILYNTLVIASTDEINVIFLDSDIFYDKFKSFKCQKSSSLIAQDVSLFFNNYFNGSRVYFDARTFNVLEEKLISYFKFRTKSTKNVGITYISKRLFPYNERKNKKCIELELLLKNNYPNALYDSDYFNYGEAYYQGKKVSLEKIINTDNFNSNEIYKYYINTDSCFSKSNSIDLDELDDFDDI